MATYENPLLALAADVALDDLLQQGRRLVEAEGLVGSPVGIVSIIKTDLPSTHGFDNRPQTLEKRGVVFGDGSTLALDQVADMVLLETDAAGIVQRGAALDYVSKVMPQGFARNQPSHDVYLDAVLVGLAQRDRRIQAYSTLHTADGERVAFHETVSEQFSFIGQNVFETLSEGPLQYRVVSSYVPGDCNSGLFLAERVQLPSYGGVDVIILDDPLDFGPVIEDFLARSGLVDASGVYNSPGGDGPAFGLDDGDYDPWNIGPDSYRTDDGSDPLGVLPAGYLDLLRASPLLNGGRVLEGYTTDPIKAGLTDDPDEAARMYIVALPVKDKGTSGDGEN